VTGRGFTVLEVIVAALVLAIVMAAAGTFYLSTVRTADDDTAQVSLQRQASFVVNELTRQIAPATLLEYPVACGGDANGLRATNSCGVFCFHRDPGTMTELLEDRAVNPAPDGPCSNPVTGTGTMNLLSGALVPAGGNAGLLSTTGAACGATAAGGFCPSLVRHSGTNCVIGAAVKFRLRAQYKGGSGYQVMTFSTSVAGRTLPIPVLPDTTCP
jgi:prepilin-type N-terminal cleavage/methylation domain-containing protein